MSRAELKALADELLALRGNRHNRVKHRRRRKRDRAAKLVGAFRAPDVKAATREFVYVIGCDGHPVKVGYSTDVTGRLAALQTSTPHKLQVYAQIEIHGGHGRAIENRAHKTLADKRLNGEWFDVLPTEAADTVRYLVAAQL